DRARDALDQRRLAGAVRPEQAVDLARAHVEVDAAERSHAGVLLDELAHLEQWLRRVHHAARVGWRDSTSVHRRSALDASTASVSTVARRPSANVGSPSGAASARMPA